MKATVIIPARMAATRFPGKPLSKILEKPMIQWVYEACSRATVDRVIVATDSFEIVEAVKSFGGEYHVTRDDHPNGTSRIAETAATIDSDIVINVQGDEPAIHPEDIEAVVTPLRANPALEMSTLAEPIQDPEDLFNPNVVKLVRNKAHHAMYFSRAPIPYVKHAGMHGPTFPTSPHITHYRHIGIYGYRRSFLLRYVAAEPCALEDIEGLEQLRALDMGASIYVGLARHASIGVDTPADLIKAERFLAASTNQHSTGTAEASPPPDVHISQIPKPPAGGLSQEEGDLS
ncbi:3-deoxy-manno-octulosonate cytidylyltransferase [Sulfidibacter corallicola]|uniref:3-deoxy-manno-octulosonate cytidylyltransferase n=1 Tax=Sulfidibacter corallicola TaxID=2818388 RepID=A0A8A4TRG3_SULCO|nr:3-deoxy-manno-octulosonate cytidylyltransferase [Sulfidibacter corallicola]QTD51987.1 3-deoxy-manno-octulosonate cytidylyltransferase [Sulfidibacter corallicola]